MTSDLISTYVDERDFTGLFIEQLGWSRPTGRPRRLDVPTDAGDVTVEEVATLKGVTVWVCPTVPDGRTQREIDRHLKQESTERLTIFHDGTRQQWKWPQTRDTAGAGAVRLVTHEHLIGRKNPALAQRLEMISLGIDEDDPSVVEVKRRLRRAFDADAVTRKFYRSFSDHHNRLCDVIDGIEVTTEDPTQSELRWYASLLMNRLMFIYFMQRKGFLDNDRNYLRNRLERLQALDRPGSFYEFYKDFLLPLFHDGLGADADDRQIDDLNIAALIGDVPYVNGGIFAEHIIEKTNDIAIPDTIFVKIFDFFDSWQWHLDDRPTGNPGEINPDVLGYIFEQFINQKQQGAYYTKEDVTGYMTENTLVPVFLERLESVTGVNPWRLLAARPERYIFDSLRHGEDTPLPDEVAAQALTWPRPAWDETVPTEVHALPGETWWETVERRHNVDALRAHLAAGRVKSASDLVTANIDLETLAVDTIDALDNPDDVVAAWRILTNLRVIDPTCGSGAFLFAALNVLHAVYSAVLDAARAHHMTKPTQDLSDLLTAADQHQSINYYLLKHAALNNIYGVDLMPEAVEIARLRLFLKLIAQVDDRQHIEPLPDLEFNIRPGNILVGALDEKDIRDRSDLTNHTRVDALIERASEASATYRSFAEAQESGDNHTARATREQLGTTILEVRTVLDNWWHEACANRSELDAYLDVHRPFHWFIEFPEVFEAGGFDVVVGNPPYVPRGEIEYRYNGFRSDDAPDIYAPCLERAATIASSSGRIAMIVPLSLSWGPKFASAREVLRELKPTIWASTYALVPAGLFSGSAIIRNTIVLGGPGREAVYTTSYNKWVSDFRPHLFPTQKYVHSPVANYRASWPKVGQAELMTFACAAPRGLGAMTRRTPYPMGFKKSGGYWLSVFVDPPRALDARRRPRPMPKLGELYFESEEGRYAALAISSSKAMLMWWVFHANEMDVTSSMLLSFPLAVTDLSEKHRQELVGVGKRLDETLRQPGDHWLWTPYKREWRMNYDFTRLRHITDDADRILAPYVGLEACLPAFETEYKKFMKIGRDRHGTVRGELPDRDR